MTDEGVSIRWNGKAVAFKWHRGRRRATDTVFTAARLREALALGASVEIDINRHGEGGFAVLHDATLDRETTGAGPVAAMGRDALRSLRLRANDGLPGDHPLLLLEDVRHLVGKAPIDPDALLQLDLKTPADALTDADCAAFASAIAGLERNVILSSEDAAAVRRLAAASSALRIGHDPCHDEARVAALGATGDIGAFVAAAVEEAGPGVEMIYLWHPLITGAAARGGNLAAAFQGKGYRVDAWTISDVSAATAATVTALLDLGVDQITTDDPIGLERLVRGI